MTIGTRDSTRISLHTSIPLLPGSMRSRRTRSGWTDRNVSMALTPSPTTSVSNPSPRRTMVSIAASAASSSTTRIFGVMVTTCVGVYVGAGAGDLPEETLPGRPLGPGHGAGSGALSAGGDDDEVRQPLDVRIGSEDGPRRSPARGGEPPVRPARRRLEHAVALVT